MSALKKSATIIVGIVTTGLCVAVPASADPGFDPCRSIAIPVCRLIPLMPDLDHDVDLTENPNGLVEGQGGGSQPSGGQSGGSQPGSGLSGR